MARTREFFDPHETFPIALPWLLAITTTGFAATALLPRVSRLPTICSAGGGGGDRLLLSAQSAPLLAVEWVLMLLAMMPPLLVVPIAHVWRSSVAWRRARALGLFVLGYTAVWTAAGAVLVPVAVALRAALPGAAALLALGLALAWSAAPMSRVALNRCHRLRRIGALGRSADRDCLAGGVSTGLDCAAACWPWMLVPLECGAAALPTMALVAALLFVERALPSAPAAWRWPLAFSLTAAAPPLRRWSASRSSPRR